MSLIYELAVQEDLNTGVETVHVTNPDGGHIDGTQIGLHSLAIGQHAFTATWDPDPIVSGEYTSTTLVVPSAEPGDFVDVSFSQMTQYIQLTAHVSQADEVRVVAFNPFSETIDMGSGTLSVLVYKVRTEE